MIGQHVFVSLLNKRQRTSLFYFLQKTIDEASQLAKRVVPVIARYLRVIEIVDN